MSYVGGDAEDEDSPLYDRLREALAGKSTPVFYLATPPSMFDEIAEELADEGLVGDGARLVVEKPFGTDLRSARELNERLTAIFPEERLFRIDHFLGKEPVQDIMYLRFANALFEPSGTASTSSPSRSRWPRTSASRIAARSTTPWVPCVTSSRTTSCRCSPSSRWSRRRETRTRSRDGARTSSRRCRRSTRRGGPWAVRRLPGHRRRGARLRHRDVRRAPARDRELALGGRADPRAGREGPADDRDRGRRPAPAGSAAAVRARIASTAPGTTTSCCASGEMRASRSS